MEGAVTRPGLGPPGPRVQVGSRHWDPPSSDRNHYLHASIALNRRRPFAAPRPDRSYSCIGAYHGAACPVVPNCALAGRVRTVLPSCIAWFNPHRDRGVDATPCGFFWNLFCLPFEYHDFFLWLSAHLVYVPPEKFKILTPLTFDLWRHNWGHVRRKMRSVAHNLQTSPFLLVIWMWTCSTK